MSAADYVAFFIPLVFIAVLWRAWSHFLAHPVALVSLLLLTLVSILHFDVGMLTTDPYDAALDDIGAPNRTWTDSIPDRLPTSRRIASASGPCSAVADPES